MQVAFVLAIICFVGCFAACPSPVANAVLPSGFCSTIWASGLNTPRGITTASNGDVIVVERGLSQLSLFYRNTAGTLQKVTLASASGLTHSVIINGGYMYLTVRQLSFDGHILWAQGTAQTIITNIPSGGHTTRTLIFSGGLLLVQVGSLNNVDSDASRSGIRQFDLSNPLPQTFTSGEWYSSGLRNEVGVREDDKGNLWGVENGMDNLNRADLGGDIHLGNPGEELNLLTKGKFFGYPYCWSQYNLSTVTTPRGTQYGVAPFLTDGIHTDTWCQNVSNVVKPAYQLPPHTAPLDLLFYYGSSFPGYNGDVFVALHGSWNSVPAVGYRVSRIHFDSNGVPVSDDPFFWYVGPGETGANWHRPVALTLIKNSNGGDVLLVTSDTTGVIIAIQYSPAAFHISH